MSYLPISAIQTAANTFGYNNASGITIPVTTPVKIRPDGDIDFINVSIETDVFALAGVVSSTTNAGLQAPVVISGRIFDINSVFTFGDPVYINKSGFLTNIKPSIGVNNFVSGDYVVRVGTIAKNANNPILQDLILTLSLVGQL